MADPASESVRFPSLASNDVEQYTPAGAMQQYAIVGEGIGMA